MVIFTQTYDLLRWALPVCEGFPKSQRFGLTARLQNAAYDFLESIYAANAQRGEARARLLHQADGHLNTLRLYLRLATQFGWLKPGQYAHASKMVNEIGKLLGGWLRQTAHSGRQGGVSRAQTAPGETPE